MKNKKGNIAVITVIIVIVAITAGVIGWMLSQKTQPPYKQSQENESQSAVSVPKIQESARNDQVENENSGMKWHTDAIKGKNVSIEIINGKKFCSDNDYPEAGYQKILKAIYADGKEKTIYSTKEQNTKDCLIQESICCTKLSLDEKYLFFAKTVWDSYKPYMINLESGQYVIDESSDIYIIKDILWSDDNKNFAITTDVSVGVAGEKGVYVSKYNNPDSYKMIWKAENYLMSEIKEVNFFGNDKLRFSVVTMGNTQDKSTYKITQYEYDYKNEKIIDSISQKQSGDAKTADWQVYKNEKYGFEFKYPENWFFDKGKLSPQKIEYYQIGSDNAPISFGVYSTDKNVFLNDSEILGFGRYEHQIKESKRNKPDSTVEINGLTFQRYDLIDSGRYEGDSAGNVILFVGPKLKNQDLIIAFEWQQFPGAKTLEVNDPQDFLDIISTFKME